MMAGAAHATISGRPATVLTINSIEEALKNAGDNFGGLCFIIGQYQLSTSYPNTPEEAKQLIQDYIASLKSQIDSKKNELESFTQSLAPFMKKEREHQLKCKQLYEEGASKLFSQEVFVKCCLELQCAGFENKLKNERTMLEDDTMRILITGELSSGKSSVLNMLMGGNFMASRFGHCTRVLCEVQHSHELKAVLYYDDTDLSPRSVDVSESEDDKIWKELQNCMQTGEDEFIAAEQRAAHKLKFIRIHWKIPFMNEELYGVTFIDVPGFYDSDESFEYIHEAIKNAHAFMFVINTSQHTGVDKDRLLRLMKDVQETIELKYGMFSPECGFFICNKWDTVDDLAREGLQKEVFQKLHAFWPRVSERQIVPLTCSLQAVTSARHGSYDDDYVEFRKRLIKFVEAATRSKTELSAWWLSAIVDRTVAIVQNMNNFLNFAKRREEILTELDNDMLKISIIKKKIKELETDFSEYIERKRDRLEKYIASYLKENKEKFLPAAFDSLLTEPEIAKEIRLQIDQHFDTDLCVKREIVETNIYADDKIISLGKMHCELEDSLKFPFGALLDSPDVENTPSNWLKWLNIKLLAWFRWVSQIAKNTVSKKEENSLDENKSPLNENFDEYLGLRTATIVKPIITSEVRKKSDALLQKTVKHFLDTIMFFLTRMQLRYDMTKALSDEIKTSSKSNEKLEMLNELSHRLQQFLINDVLHSDIDKQRLVFTLQEGHCLGSGSFGTVYRGTYTDNTEVTPVALKIIRMPCECAETYEGLYHHRECVLLRMLSVKPAAQREHVVEYLGHYSEVTSFVRLQTCSSV